MTTSDASQRSPDGVLAVCAHPDDESFGLGAVLGSFAAGGSAVTVLSFTHGEASTLHGVAGDLRSVRARELTDAARCLDVTRVELLDYPDGGLSAAPVDELADRVVALARDAGAATLLVFDEGGVTGHPDHQAATTAAVTAAATLDASVLAWTIPQGVADRLNTEFGTTFVGRDRSEIDRVVAVDRAAQLRAIACHRSQSADNPVLRRRLELLGDTEWLRVLR